MDKKKAYLFPLSNAQERLWILSQINSDQPIYNLSIAVSLMGQLDIDSLFKSIQAIVDRHEVLRTSFKVVDNVPKQLIVPSIELSIEDFLAYYDHEMRGEIQQWIDEASRKQIDLSVAPEFSIRLLKLGNKHHLFFINFHHIIFDEWSVGVFFRELKELYDAYTTGREPVLPDLPIQYADYAVRQREWMQGEVLERLLGYWKKKLATLEGLELPVDRPRPAEHSFRGLTYRTKMGKDLSKRLKEFARAEGLTLNMLMLTVFQVLLYRYTQQEDVAVGMPIANRNRVELEDLIGFFVNTLVIRTDLSGEPTFRELLGKVKETLLEAYEYQDLPFDKLVEALNPERDLSRTPLFQVMFVMEDESIGVQKIGEMEAQPLDVETGTSKFDLTMFVGEVKDQLQVSLEYSTDLFNADRIERMAGHYQRLLEDIVEHPEKKIWELELLTEAEKHQILVEWNDTDVVYPKDKCVQQLFEAQVKQTPDAVAVLFGEEQLTYRELNERANQLGHYLQKLGVGPGVLVGICVERSLEMIVGLLGILKAGGAYVPLDPSYPKERLRFMLEDAQAPVLLTQATLGVIVENTQIVSLDTDWSKVETESVINVISEVSSDDLIYVIYTSGSTGKPKGAKVIQRGFVNLINWFSVEFHLGANDRTLLISSYSFDLTQKDIFTPLIVGGLLCLPKLTYYDPEGILSLIREHNITWINCTPSAFYPLIDYGVESEKIKNHLRYVFLGGEPIAAPKLTRWAIDSPVEIVNTYGPTECSDVSSSYVIPSLEMFQDRTIPIGRAIYNVRQYVLDKKLKLCPIGVQGELYIGGVGVGKGYVRSPGLTTEKFVADPFGVDSSLRMYKTGDVVRNLPDGNIVFLGRVDDQVKIRGFRVELREVESILVSHPAVKQAVVLLQDENKTGFQQLVAYLVLQDDYTSVLELRQFVASRLPAYMVPSTFTLLKELPLTPSGKIDRKRLMGFSITKAEPKVQHVLPQTLAEHALSEIWSEVLGINDIGIQDNFFELGGNSLQALMVISRIARLGIRVSLSAFYKEPTILGVLNIPSKTMVNRIAYGLFPLSPRQFVIYEPEYRNPNSSAFQRFNSFFTLVDVYDAHVALDNAAVEQTVNTLIEHHSELTIHLVESEKEILQEYTRDSNVHNFVSFHSIEGFSALGYLSEFNALIKDLQQRINIFRQAFHVAFVKSSGFPDRIVVILHHLFGDEFSMEIIRQDLETIYLTTHAKQNLYLPSRTTPVAEWISRLGEYATRPTFYKDFEYWATIAKSSIASLPSGAYSDEKSRTRISSTLTLNETQLLAQKAKELHVTGFEVLLTYLFKVLTHYVQGENIGIKVVKTGRDPMLPGVDLSHTIGFFSFSIPLIINSTYFDDFDVGLAKVKEQLSFLPDRQLAYLAARMNANTYEPARDILRKVKIGFNYYDAVLGNEKIFSRTSLALDWEHEAAVLGEVIYVNVEKSSDGILEYIWLFDPRFYKPDEIQCIADEFGDMIRKFISGMSV